MGQSGTRIGQIGSLWLVLEWLAAAMITEKKYGEKMLPATNV